MREIKFRALQARPLPGKQHFVYGQITEPNGPAKGVAMMDVGHGERWQVDMNTVGQYTGLKDKTGKEIYEGDIVDDGEHIYDIRWDKDEARFMAANTLSSVFWVPMGWYDDFKVIGNIHETPELLEKEEWT